MASIFLVLQQIFRLKVCACSPLLLLIAIDCFALADRHDPNKKGADCVFVGSFSKVADIYIDGRKTRPVSLAVGSFGAVRLLKGRISSCRRFQKGEFDVVFSRGDLSTGAVMGEACDVPVKMGAKYEIHIRARETGAYIQSACRGWIREVSSHTDDK